MTHIAFVTTELAPFTPGGAGVLISSLVTLLRDRGDRVSIVLCAQPNNAVGDPDVVVAPQVTAPGWDFSFMDVSMSAAEALSDMHATNPIDAVEFQDFDGLGFWTLTHRRDLGLGSVPISVRVHGPVDLQIESMGVSSFDLDVVASMESEAFRMADRIVVPSSGIANLVTSRYDLDSDRVVEGSPVVRMLDDEVRWTEGGSRFLVVGRLSEVKGSHDMVQASVPVLRQFPSTSVTFVGADGWSISTDQPMNQFLETLIPSDVADQFEFIPHSEPTAIAELMAGSIAVVVPSRFESFNLAAHEARALGAPVIVPSTPAFKGSEFETAGLMTYDGSVEDLTRVLAAVAANPGIAADVAGCPTPELGDPLAPYVSPMAEVRHERSQGGVATAALARVEAVRFDPARQGQQRSLLKRVLQKAPTGMIDALKPLVPRALKGKIKSTVGWDGLVDARNWDERWAKLTNQSAAGFWALDGAPRVSVVIPCYNQGSFLRQAIISVFDQTISDFDIVVVDDGSDDRETMEILDTLDLDRVMVVRQANRGLPGARNSGIRVAEGELIVTLDADDMLAPSYLERMVEALDGQPGAAFAHCWAELFGDFQSIWATRPENSYQMFISNSVVGCVTIRKAAWEEVGGYDESMINGNEDWDLWIRLLHAGRTGIQVREPLFRYRKHGVSMSVETEGSYESAIDDLPRRLPHIYNRSYLGERKSRDYPLLTVLSPLEVSAFRHATGDDFQHIDIDGSDPASAAPAIRGKYVVLWPEGAVAENSALERLCFALENEPDAGAAATTDDSPIVVVRTWSLHDPDGPQRQLATAVEGSADRRIAPSEWPDVARQVPNEINGVAVQRQRPEEAGTIPDWVPA